MNDGSPLDEQLLALARETPWLTRALKAADEQMTAPWCIAAGAVRSLVWNYRHGLALLPPQELDLVFFDPDSERAVDDVFAVALEREVPGFQWDVVNQAHAHTLTGDIHAPKFTSLEHAIACWPETATAVGIFLDEHGELAVLAPYGLVDLFALVLRPSPGLRHPEAFTRRLSEKRFVERWPRLRVASLP